MLYLVNILSTILLLALIVWICVIFTNAVEHFGKEYKLNDGAVGGILAAVGTALPETIVPLVAILAAFITKDNIEVGAEIGLGAILGAPFLLSTLAFFVSGLAVIIFTKMKRREMTMTTNSKILLRDLKFFSVSYSLAILCGFIPIKFIKYAIAGMLVCYYLFYVIETLHQNFGDSEAHEDLQPLLAAKILPFLNKHVRFLIWFQIIFSLVGLVFLAHEFVHEIKYFAHLFHLNPLVMSLLLAPIATELPEKFNSVIWLSVKKDTLAISNITGALVFQSCIPTCVGILLTPWVFSAEAIVNVVLVYCSLILVYFSVKRNNGIICPRILTTCGLFYLIYIIYIFHKILVA